MNSYKKTSIIICIFVRILVCSNIIVCILVQTSLIILIPVQVIFCQFLENGNSYRADFFRLY